MALIIVEQQKRKDLQRRVAPKVKNTQCAYSPDWNQFQSWCLEYGDDALPAEADTIIACVVNELILRKTLKVGAVCVSSARTDLCRGCRVTGIPTATRLLDNIREYLEGIGAFLFRDIPRHELLAAPLEAIQLLTI